MTTLHIIGNGFDLHHKLPTSYENYLKFLDLDNPFKKNKFSDQDRKKAYIDEIYPVGINSRDEFFIADMRQEQENKNWSNLESKLGSCLRNVTEAKKFIEQIVEMKMIYNDSKLKKWIMSVNCKLSDTKKSDHFVSLFKPDDYFITFNYTDTLQEVYGISKDKILYIHGRASDGKSKLVFGHSYDISRDIRENCINSLDTGVENIRDLMKRNKDFRDILNDYYKDIPSIIKNNNIFFESLSEINHINIIGHEISNATTIELDIDYPYDPKKAYGIETMDDQYYNEIKKHTTKIRSIDHYFYFPEETRKQLITIGKKMLKEILEKIKEIGIYLEKTLWEEIDMKGDNAHQNLIDNYNREFENQIHREISYCKINTVGSYTHKNQVGIIIMGNYLKNTLWEEIIEIGAYLQTTLWEEINRFTSNIDAKRKEIMEIGSCLQKVVLDKKSEIDIFLKHNPNYAIQGIFQLFPTYKLYPNYPNDSL